MKKLLILLLGVISLIGLSACELEMPDGTTAHVHIYSKVVMLSMPTCTERGKIRFTCECGDTYYAEIKEKGHTYTDTVIPPTCTENGYTLHKCACGDEYTDNETSALGHTPSEAVEENRIEPTCTEEGAYESVVYCSICSTEITRETIVLDTTAHNYEIDETTIQKASNNLYEFNIVCKDCDKSIFVSAGKSKTVAPTCCEQGYSEYLYFYKASDRIVSDTVNLDFTEPIPHLHTLGYDEDGEPLQFEAYGLSEDNKTYIITPLIQGFLDSGKLKLNGGHMAADTELATFDCVHCHKLIVIRLEKGND